MENILCNNMMYKYWGKSRIPRKFTEDDVSFHLLLYHCLDVAAMGQVLLQQLLQQDAYEDILTQNITHDKDNSLSLITFFLALHDLGKFSKGFQNSRKDIVNILHGQLNNQKSENQEKIGFYLWQKIWPKVWQENWLSL